MSTILYSYHNAETPDDMPRRFVDEARESKHLCRNCGLAAPFDGWEDCLACGTATALVEDPDYINFARRVHKKDSPWLKALEREWERQSTALASVPVPNLRARQAG